MLVDLFIGINEDCFNDIKDYLKAGGQQGVRG